MIVAALFSSSGKKTPAQQAAAKGQPPQPTLQDNTDSNVQELKNQLQAEHQKEQQATMAAAEMGDSALASATPQQRAAAAAYGPTGLAVPCIPGQPCPQAQPGNMQMQLTPLQQQAQLIAAKERERADNSRFASNLVYSRSADPPQQQQQGQTMPAQYGPAERRTNSSLVAPPAEGKQEDTPGGYKRPLEANIDSAVGQPYLVYEGSVLDTVLMNRLDGDAVGPVKVLVSNPLYSHDHQHVIIPEGTVVLGEAKKIGAAGFGQQRRMAVVFHRLIMPDGYSVDLDQFQGLDQIGQEGLKDKVNNHYLQIFGTSIALGVIAGASEITQGGGTITTSGSQAFTNGAAGSVSQSATTILESSATRGDLPRWRVSLAGTQMKALLWSVSAAMYPAFVRASLRAFSCALRQLALLLRLRRPPGYGFPPNLVRKDRRKDFSGTSVNAELRHLGAWPTRFMMPRPRSGDSTNGDHHVPEQSNPHRLPR